MSNTTDPNPPRKLPEPRLPDPKAAAAEEADEAEVTEAPEPDDASSGLPEPPAIGGTRARSDTFVQRKTDAKKVGIDTAFVDGLTADLILEGVPDELVPEGARGDAVDADALFEADAELVAPAPTKSASPPPPPPSSSASPVAAEAKGDPGPGASRPRKPTLSLGPDMLRNPATLAIGGALVAIVLLLAFKTCSSPSTGEGTDGAVASARAGEGAAGAAGGAGAGAGGAGGGAAEGRGGDGEGGGGDGEGGGGDDAAEGGGGGAAAEGAEAADEGDAAAADEGDPDAASAETGAADEVAVVDEGDGGSDAAETPSGSGAGERRSGSGSSSASSPASTKTTPDPDRAAEAAMSAEELLAAAKESLKHKRYRDAYRQSTSSYHKKSTDEALKVRVESACGMNNKSAAKSSFDKVSRGPDRRDLRSKCREHGVRLGL